MHIQDRVVVVTGGGHGIGAALCRGFARAGARAVVVVDLDASAANLIAADLARDDSIESLALGADVTVEADIQRVIAETRARFGDIDIFCSNAGVSFGDAPSDTSQITTAASADNEKWMACWNVHVMAHVYAARALLPRMIERGEGHLLSLASAAGLLNQVGEAAYSATKHAAVSFAESLAINHWDDGIRVSVVCPQAVATRMIGFDQEGVGGNAVDGVLSPDTVAEIVIAGVEADEFLILPHPQVQTYCERKAKDRKRWLDGMRRFRRKLLA